MSLYESQTYREDLIYVLNSDSCITDLDGSSILITGATGLICSAIIDLIIAYNENFNGNIQIYTAGREYKKVYTRFAPYSDKDYFHYVAYDASQMNEFNFAVDYIIHGASNAYPYVIQKHPVDTMLNNFQGVYELLQYALKIQSKKLLFISSSEIYGEKESMDPFDENDYGRLDLLNPRSAYSSGKRAAETMCACFSAEKGVNTTIVRPGHIFGPTASRADNRVASVFAYQAADGKDLILKSSGNQIRSYCYMLDAATAIVKVMLQGNIGEAYNISNPDSIMTIRELAKLYAEYGNVNLKFELPTESERAAFNPMLNSSLNGNKLLKLGWNGFFNARISTARTIDIIKEAHL